MTNNKVKYLLVTDIPAPWREKVYEIIHAHFGNAFHVVYCNHNEKRRLWEFPAGSHPKTFLKAINITSDKLKKENYLNLGIIPFILKHRPKIIVCFSLVPTIFITLALSKLIKAEIIVLADTWTERDSNISCLQRSIRKIIYNHFAKAFIGASKQTLKWYKLYNNNISSSMQFLSALCADNDYFNNYLEKHCFKKKYDMMFSGRIVDLKNPLFFAEVVTKVKKILGHCSVLIIGEGDENLKADMFGTLEKHGIDYNFPGFVKHSKLPEYYAQSKILLLPTSGDCWGVVINEAMVSGVPVITTNMTAAAGELVLNDINGYVLPLDADLWTEKIVALLTEDKKLNHFSKAAKDTVRKFNFDTAAEGIIKAIEYVEINKTGIDKAWNSSRKN